MMNKAHLTYTTLLQVITGKTGAANLASLLHLCSRDYGNLYFFTYWLACRCE